MVYYKYFMSYFKSTYCVPGFEVRSCEVHNTTYLRNKKVQSLSHPDGLSSGTHDSLAFAAGVLHVGRMVSLLIFISSLESSCVS